MKQSAVYDAITSQHIAILGKTGSGKTFTAKGIAEHLLDHKRQLCVLDPTGAWWGMRLAADGKAKGYDVILLGGKHGDVPLHPSSGAAVARLVTGQLASVIIDTSGMTVGEYTRWFIDFAGTLYTTIREPLHLIIDEAHYFMPQGKAPDVDAGRMIHAGNRLMSGGRSLGIRGMMITQRPAKLHKDSLTCADTLIAMRVIAPQDRAAIKEWVDGCGDPAQGKQVLDSLAQLARGEGWIWYPEGGILQRTKFPGITTYDSSATPKHGQKAPEPGAINLDEVKAALADAVAQAEANDPKKLRERIAELERAAKAGKHAAAPAVDVEAIRAQGYASGLADGHKEAERALRPFAVSLGGIYGDMSKTLSGLLYGKVTAREGQNTLSPPPHLNGHAPAARTTPVLPPAPRPARESARAGDGKPTPQQRVLNALGFLAGAGVSNPDRFQLGVAAGVNPAGGYFDRVLRPMVEEGLVVRESGNVVMTEVGARRAQPPQIKTMSEYHAVVTGMVGGPAARLLDVMLKHGPEASLSREDLGNEANVNPAGGYFDRCIRPLAAMGMVRREKGMVKATTVLFPAGLR